MSQVEALKQTIRTLPKEQVRELQDYVEDLEEMRPEFVARLDRAQQQLDEGKGRVVDPLRRARDWLRRGDSARSLTRRRNPTKVSAWKRPSPTPKPISRN